MRDLGQTVRDGVAEFSRNAVESVALGGWPDEQLPCRYSGGNPRWADDLAGGVTRALRAQTPVALAGGGRGGVRGRQRDPEGRRSSRPRSCRARYPGTRTRSCSRLPSCWTLRWVNIAWIAARFAIVLWTAAIATGRDPDRQAHRRRRARKCDRRRRRRHDDRGAGRRGAARSTFRRELGVEPDRRREHSPAAWPLAEHRIAPPGSGSTRPSGWRWRR